MWEDDTMWKYRDISELTERNYFKNFVGKYAIKSNVINKNITFVINQYSYRIYGFTIENCLYCDIYDINRCKKSSFDKVVSHLFVKGFCRDLYESTIKNYPIIGIENLVEMERRDFFYNIYVLDNFYEKFTSDKYEELINDEVHDFQIQEYEKLLKEYYTDLYEKYRKK